MLPAEHTPHLEHQCCSSSATGTMPGTEVEEGTTSWVKWLSDRHLPLAMKLILEAECKLVDEFCPSEGHEGGARVQVCKGCSQLHTAEHTSSWVGSQSSTQSNVSASFSTEHEGLSE